MDEVTLVKKFGTAILPRMIVSLTMIFAWLLLSNHCALSSVLAESSHNAAEHACCANDFSYSAPHHDSKMMSCCQVVKPILAESVTAPSFDFTAFTLAHYVVAEIVFSNAQSSSLTSALDTGPPPALSFAESILQRSILSHAPPFLV